MVGDGDKGIIFSNGTTLSSKETGNLLIGPWSDYQKGIKIVGSTGNIGINNENPNATLDVSGSINSSNGFYSNGIDISTIGYNQIWRTYSTSQRNKVTLYANFQKSIQINIGVINNEADDSEFVIQAADNASLTNNLYICRGYTSSSMIYCSLTSIIPYGWYYRLMKIGDPDGSDNWDVNYWTELRNT